MRMNMKKITELFTRKFNLIIKQCCLIVESAEKRQKVKTQKLYKQKNGKIMVSSNCAVCGRKISNFIKLQEAKELLRIIDKIPLIGPLI